MYHTTTVINDQFIQSNPTWSVYLKWQFFVSFQVHVKYSSSYRNTDSMTVFNGLDSGILEIGLGLSLGLEISILLSSLTFTLTARR